MASGQQLAEQNVAAFAAWVASKTDDDFRAMANRGVLSRKEVAKECGFAKSALDQNPRIKAASARAGGRSAPARCSAVGRRARPRRGSRRP
jgi:hypothetical protein